jgi:hypothetical protein
MKEVVGCQLSVVSCQLSVENAHLALLRSLVAVLDCSSLALKSDFPFLPLS